MHTAASSYTRTRARRLGAALVTALALAMVAPAAAAAACEGESANPNHVSLDVIDRATVCLVNAERTKRGMRALKSNARLAKAARRHAVDMVNRGYFAHGNFAGRIRATRYLAGANGWMLAENIAWGSMHFATPKNVVSRWMGSPGHRANILNPRLREIGQGVARGAPVRGMRDAATYVNDFGTRR